MTTTTVLELVATMFVIVSVTSYAADWLLRGRRLREFSGIAERIAARTGLTITVTPARTLFSVSVVRGTGANSATVAAVDPMPAEDVKPWLFGIDAGYRLAGGRR